MTRLGSIAEQCLHFVGLKQFHTAYTKYHDEEYKEACLALVNGSIRIGLLVLGSYLAYSKYSNYEAKEASLEQSNAQQHPGAGGPSQNPPQFFTDLKNGAQYYWNKASDSASFLKARLYDKVDSSFCEKVPDVADCAKRLQDFCSEAQKGQPNMEKLFQNLSLLDGLHVKQMDLQIEMLNEQCQHNQTCIQELHPENVYQTTCYNGLSDQIHFECTR